MKPIIISDALMKSVYAEARNSYPAECCGWLTGGRSGSYVDRIRRCDNDQSSGNHPTQPERGVETAWSDSDNSFVEIARYPGAEL